MFDDEKIKIIQAMPEGDSLLVVWIKLITLAGKTNDGGYIYIAENMPYTEEMLSTIMNKPINTIRLALSTFLSLKMIEEDTKGIYLINFEKHQSLDKMEKLKEQNRIRVAKYRDKKKQELLECNDDVTLHVMQSNGIDIDIFTLVIYINAIVCKHLGVTGELAALFEDPTKLAAIYGFNFIEDLQSVYSFISKQYLYNNLNL